MIMEAIENKEQKQRNREKEYERKREAKRRERMLYHLRHAKVRTGVGEAPGAWGGLLRGGSRAAADYRARFEPVIDLRLLPYRP